jgi:putative endonuclease
MHSKYKGILGEFIGRLVLICKGFTILAKRYKTVCGEIDIIAQKGDLVVFVEVKSRKNIDKCYTAIVDKQLNRIQRASQIFLSKNSKLSTMSIRYDVILVSDWSFPIHIENVSM